QQILPVESAKSDQLSTTRPGISFAGNITPVSQQKSPLLKETPIQTWEHLGKSILYAIAGDDIQSYFGFRPSISIVKSPLPMASIGESGRIIFSSGLLSMLTSQEEFAFVISHEIAHQLLGHHSGTGHQWSLEEESKADELALRLLEVGGYRSAGAISILEKLERFGADAGLALDALHPTLSARRLRLSELLITQATMGSPLHL
ncbi:MAG: M48 family metallopeptidase, partial [Bdellovibrionales bacterium]|nr:M48 family metallopeptidase [Bdellovibrionales bacterium]